MIARGSQLNNELTRLVFPWPGPRMLCAGESGLASWQDEVDRPGAHGINSLSGLRGYGGGASTSPGSPGNNDSRHMGQVLKILINTEYTDQYCTY